MGLFTRASKNYFFSSFFFFFFFFFIIIIWQFLVFGMAIYESNSHHKILGRYITVIR